MSTAWHRAEPREVRPFFETVKAENALVDSAIRLFPGGDFLPDTSFDLEEMEFRKLEPIVQISLFDPAVWMPSGLSVEDLELVLVARHPFLKRSDIVDRWQLADAIPADVAIGSDILEKMGGGRNLQLTLALCLAHDRDPIPGAPFVPGHWLARKAFFLRSRTMPALFDLRTRTDEEWVKNKYPPKTFYSIDYIGGIAGEMEDGSSVATVWVHADAHSRMVSQPIGETLQPLLASEIITAILVMSFDEWKDTEVVHPASPLFTLAKQLGENGPLGFADLKALVGDSSRLRAILQDRLSVVRSIK